MSRTTPTATQIDHREGGPDPHLAQRAALTLLAEERGDDPDDQGRLEALTQADYECGKHGKSGPSVA